MSDFTDFFNENEGYYTFAGGVAGISQRSQLLANQHRLLEQQIAQARHAEAHGRQVAEHQRKIEVMERERLRIEKERLNAEQEQQRARAEEGRWRRGMRKFLSSMIDELHALQRAYPISDSDSEDMDFTLRLAVLQAAIEHLAKEDAFEDLADMQAFSKLQADVADFVARSAECGRTRENPLEFVRGQLRSQQFCLSQMAGFIAACEKPAKILKSRAFYEFSQQEIAGIQANARKLLAHLPIELSEFTERLDSSKGLFEIDLNSVHVQTLAKISGDGMPLYQLLADTGMSEADYVQAAACEGWKYAELTASLNWAIEEADRWNASMEARAKVVESIRDEAESGNYQTAGRLLKNTPRPLLGANYDSISDLVTKWACALETQEQNLHSVGILFRTALKETWFEKRCEMAIAVPMKSIRQFEEHANSLPDCEYKREALAMMRRINNVLSGLRQQASVAQRQFTTAVAIVCTVCSCIIGVVLYAQRAQSSIDSYSKGPGVTKEAGGSEEIEGAQNKPASSVTSSGSLASAGNQNPSLAWGEMPNGSPTTDATPTAPKPSPPPKVANPTPTPAPVERPTSLALEDGTLTHISEVSVARDGIVKIAHDAGISNFKTSELPAAFLKAWESSAKSNPAPPNAE